MTDKERDPEADGPEGATDPEPEADATGPGADDNETADDVETTDAADDDGELAADDEADGAGLDDEDAADAGPETAAGTPARAGAGHPRTRGTTPKAAPAPTAADDAVHIQDRVSSYFVIVTVGVFVVILAWALLLGRNGPMSDIFATPKPIATPVETVIPSVAPESPGSSASPVSPSDSPTAS